MSDPSTSAPIKGFDGKLITERSAKLGRWAEYCSTLLNRPPPPPSPELITAATSASPDLRINCAPPTLTKTITAIGKLKSNKATGCCNITPRMLKNGGPMLSKALHDLFVKVWETNTIPCDWRTGVILPLYKGKGSKSDCGNHRGITLLSVPGKAFAPILLERIKPSSSRNAAPSRAASFLVGRLLIVFWP